MKNVKCLFRQSGKGHAGQQLGGAVAWLWRTAQRAPLRLCAAARENAELAMADREPAVRYETGIFVLFVAFLLALQWSFLEGWFFDGSKPISGAGWADQDYYRRVAQKLAAGIGLAPSDFHYQIGYSLLSALALLVAPEADPFALVSFMLLSASCLFCFLGARYHFSPVYAFLFIGLLFIREGQVRELYYAQEIFLIPWNNQVLFACFAVLFWAFSKAAAQGALSLFDVMLIAAVSGYTVTTREESLLFLAPALLYLAVGYAGLRLTLMGGVIFVIFASPNLAAKYSVFGSIIENARLADEGAGYMDKLKGYMSISGLYHNLIDVIWNAQFRGVENVNRDALLQRQPWLWLAPFGLMLIYWVYGIKHPISVFVTVSLALLVFYLAGENMSAQKLKFHCLRYISPSFIALNLGVTYLISNVVSAIDKEGQRGRGHWLGKKRSDTQSG